MPRRKISPKINLVISAVFHAAIIAVFFLFAAHEGILGHKLQEITAVLVPKEKPPEPPKPEPRIEPPKAEPKVEEPPPQAVAKSEPAPQVAAPPPGPSGPSAPAVAPAAVIPADFSFADGAKEVITSANAGIAYYKNFVEYTLRENWNRPDDLTDKDFADEVEVQIDRDGYLKSYSLKKKSGNKRWDESVLQAIASTKSIGRVPPTNFPSKFEIRFDVQPASESLTP
ncbi:MAG TPA: energy transducer TonB [Verrucomicrobiae bacterium]|jgi:outer membrane biosynthesis protein TonB|nr:energy transducer TonB [Verrucomicrobiae bacterium]